MKLKSLDFFRKLPNDIETSSVSGGLFSLFAILIGVLLFLSEYRLFSTEEVIKEMIIDNDQVTTTMRLNINFTFLKVPCIGLSLDQEDEIGNHIPDVGDTLRKIRMNEKEEIISQNYGEGNPNYLHSQEESNDFLQAFKNKEKCMLVGHLIVNKVPGDFHVSYHTRKDLYQSIHDRGEHEIFNNIDMSHKINSLSFGTPINQEKIEKILKEFKAVHPNFMPYNNIEKSSEGKNNYMNFIKVIPNTFKDEKNKIEINTFQFSMNSRLTRIDQHSMPSTYYNYEVSPITVVYKVRENSFIHFLVQICAIVGGIFSVIGILNSLTLASCNLFKRNNKAAEKK